MADRGTGRRAGSGAGRLSGILLAVLLVLSAGTAATAVRGLDLVVMLDMGMDATQPGASNLPSQNIINSLAGGARVTVTQLRAGDRVSLVTFSEIAKTVVPMTDDFSKFEAALRKVGRWVVQRDRRHLYDSLLAAIGDFPEIAQPERQRCIVVVTTASDV